MTDPTIIPKTHPGGTLLILDVEASHFSEVLDRIYPIIIEQEGVEDKAQQEEIYHLLHGRGDQGADMIRNGVAVFDDTLDIKGINIQVFIRLAEEISDVKDQNDVPVRYIWFLACDQRSHPHMPKAIRVANKMESEPYKSDFASMGSKEDFEGLMDKLAQKEDMHIPPELQATGKFAGGIVNDIKRKIPHYWSDFRDGFSSKSIASVFFLYFACLAPAIAFGGLLAEKTHGEIGVMEMILATALCGTIYALVSGQPLTILGSTGPVIIFMGILFTVTESYGLPYLPTLSWVGIWTMVIMLILALTDASSLIRYFTRFTDETFAALISLIFIYEAVIDMVKGFTEDKPVDVALLTLILSIGTFYIAMSLSRMRSGDYLRRQVREFLADFGPTIAMGIMTLIAFYIFRGEVNYETLEVPQEFKPTADRAWLVNPLEAPQWVWFASIIPAFLVSILLYLDQNITVRLVNNPQNKLKKGSGYHLDLAVVGGLVGLCSMFGLPWMVAATVRSLNHVRSLNKLETVKGKEVITGTIENRLTALLVHVAIGASLLILNVLQLMPMSVLFGLFLFMGVASMKGNQLFERLRLWFMDPARYPSTHYLRAVPTRVVHMFTAIQAICLAVLWVVKTSIIAITFPLFIALLVPVRFVMDRFFDGYHLAMLDAEELPEEEEYRESD
ncbi:MAG: sodium bicarbonate transporter family protein [Bacteroidota bacterium]